MKGVKGRVLKIVSKKTAQRECVRGWEHALLKPDLQ